MKQELAANFKLKDFGEAKPVLGMNICIDKDKEIITLDQKQYIDELLVKFKMSDCKSINTTMEKNLNLEKGASCDFCHDQARYLL